MGKNDRLFVEGRDDQHVVYSLMQHHAVEKTFEVVPEEGIDKLLRTLRVAIKGSDTDRLGIVADADVDLEARWTAITNILKNAGYKKLPKLPSPEGTIITQSEKPRIGIWLMPNNTVPGMLEDFIEFLVPDGDALWKQAGQCVETIAGMAKFPPQHKIKACVHTWLAWQEEPGKPLGQAITARYFNAEAQYAHQFVAWIRRLFVE